MELYYKLSDDAMGRCGEVAPDQTFNVPCEAVYAAPYELYFKPRDNKYLESKSAFNWKEKVSEKTMISCPAAKSNEAQPIFFTVCHPAVIFSLLLDFGFSPCSAQLRKRWF